MLEATDEEFSRMVPRVFVSSTIADLVHVRNALKRAIEELSYEPVLSEHGGVPFMSTEGVVNSCYNTVSTCHIAILIIGRRYGSKDSNGLSITHNEFHSIKKRNLPLITLIDRDVATYAEVYKLNNSDIQLPGITDAKELFGLLQEIKDEPAFNGVCEFSATDEAVGSIKKHLAHLFGSYLQAATSPMASDIKDIMAEIATLREDLRNKTSMSDDDLSQHEFQRVARVLVSDQLSIFRKTLEQMTGGFDAAVRIVMSCGSLFALFAELSYNLESIDSSHIPIMVSHASPIDKDYVKRDLVFNGFAIDREGKIIFITHGLLKHFEDYFGLLKQAQAGTA